LCPVFLMILTLLSWSVLPLSYGNVYSDVSSGILVTLVISSLSVYGIIMAGWSSNSKYAFLGGLRAAAQMISYEVGIGLYMLMGCGFMRSLNLTVISENQYYVWLAVPLHMVCVLLFISSLAETNRAPFDMAEAEAELVSGYNVEYSSMTFALFFIAEYGTILLMSVLLVLLFLGGWKCYMDSRVIYSLKVVIILALFILVRAALPRYRYDQLMSLGWKKLLPLGLGFVLFMGGLKFGALDLCVVTENT
jgi:NADH-quinone oxidoreductase subunit H